MAFLCKKCGRSWADSQAEENQFLCTRQCGGELTGAAMPDFSRLPSVLALPLHEYYSETHPVMQLHRLFDAVEILTRFLTIIRSANYGRGLATNRYLMNCCVTWSRLSDRRSGNGGVC